jgi:hypothetical protein
VSPTTSSQGLETARLAASSEAGLFGRRGSTVTAVAERSIATGVSALYVWCSRLPPSQFQRSNLRTKMLINSATAPLSRADFIRNITGSRDDLSGRTTI